MRCPKCGYISFDYNKFCPKCSKDISEEQTKLNLHGYRHAAPSLLGMLVGLDEDSSPGFTPGSAAAIQRGGTADDDTSAIIDHDIDFDEDDQDLEISLSDDSLELPEISMDDQPSDLDSLELGDDEDEVLILEPEPDEEAAVPEAETGEDQSLALDDISMKGEKGFSTIELNVSDLKINETGELEIDTLSNGEPRVKASGAGIGSITAAGKYSSGSIDTNGTSNLDLEDLAIDDADISAGQDSLDLDSLIFEETDESESASAAMAETLNISALNDNGTASLDLGDLAISEDDTDMEQDDSIDLSDLSFDGDDLNSTGVNIVAEAMDLDNLETGELDLGSIDIEDAEDKIETGGTLDDSQSFDLSSLNDSMADLTLDIENLDLDLDLDIPEDKK